MDIILDITPNFPREYKFTIGNKMHDIGVGLIADISAAYLNRDRAIRIQYFLFSAMGHPILGGFGDNIE